MLGSDRGDISLVGFASFLESVVSRVEILAFLRIVSSDLEGWARGQEGSKVP